MKGAPILIVIRRKLLAWLSLVPLATVGLVVFMVAETGDNPLQGWVVAVDPGHGGKDEGACHLPTGTIEKEINLDVGLRVRDLLIEVGAQPVMTRDDDESFPSLSARATTANDAGAQLFISIHANRFPSPDCFGGQAFYLGASEEGRRLALLMQEELIRIQPANRRTALPGNYRVLRETRMPGVLVEVGFVTSPTDRELLADPDYRDRLAEAILRGAERFAAGEGRDNDPEETDHHQDHRLRTVYFLPLQPELIQRGADP